jgi:hypothetical protein
MNHAADWMGQIHRYFNRHPEHQFELTTIPISALSGVSAAGWFVGMASAPSLLKPAQPLVPPGCNAITCVVRRADEAEGRPLPGVFLMDGAPPALPRGGTGRGKEHFCERLWGLVQRATELNVSLAALMQDPAMLASAVAKPLPDCF